KRSWKNLLINKQYQLRFTLFMVGISAVLMTALGWWVLRTANQATDVASGSVSGPCPAVPTLMTADNSAPASTAKLVYPSDPPGSAAVAPEVPPAAPDGSGSASGSGSGSGSGSASGSGAGVASDAPPPSGDDDLAATHHRHGITVTEDPIIPV